MDPILWDDRDKYHFLSAIVIPDVCLKSPYGPVAKQVQDCIRLSSRGPLVGIMFPPPPDLNPSKVGICGHVAPSAFVVGSSGCQGHKGSLGSYTWHVGTCSLWPAPCSLL